MSTDLYDPSSREDMRKLFDCYMKDCNNDCKSTPRVRLSVLDKVDKYVTAVVALRDITDGEEITVSYGQSRATMEEADFIL